MRQGPLSEKIRQCQRCDLFKQCTRPVPGEGSFRSGVTLLGRNPGQTEDREGRPFIGPGGKRLFQTLEKLGFQRSQFYVTNIVKCYTQGDAPPSAEQISACRIWLEPELQAVNTHFVIALGNQAFSLLRNEKSSTLMAQRQVFTFEPLGFRYVGVVHPGAAVRNGQRQEQMRDGLDFALNDVLGLPRVANFRH